MSLTSGDPAKKSASIVLLARPSPCPQRSQTKADLFPADDSMRPSRPDLRISTAIAQGVRPLPEGRHPQVETRVSRSIAVCRQISPAMLPQRRQPLFFPPAVCGPALDFVRRRI